jgi:hypothetical protein
MELMDGNIFFEEDISDPVEEFDQLMSMTKDELIFYAGGYGIQVNKYMEREGIALNILKYKDLNDIYYD